MGNDIDWADCQLMQDQAECMLAALGLLHMSVKVVVDDADDKYEAAVSDAHNRLKHVH